MMTNLCLSNKVIHVIGENLCQHGVELRRNSFKKGERSMIFARVYMYTGESVYIWACLRMGIMVTHSSEPFWIVPYTMPNSHGFV